MLKSLSTGLSYLKEAWLRVTVVGGSASWGHLTSEGPLNKKSFEQRPGLGQRRRVLQMQGGGDRVFQSEVRGGLEYLRNS